MASVSVGVVEVLLVPWLSLKNVSANKASTGGVEAIVIDIIWLLVIGSGWWWRSLGKRFMMVYLEQETSSRKMLCFMMEYQMMHNCMVRNFRVGSTCLFNPGWNLSSATSEKARSGVEDILMVQSVLKYGRSWLSRPNIRDELETEFKRKSSKVAYGWFGKRVSCCLFVMRSVTSARLRTRRKWVLLSWIAPLLLTTQFTKSWMAAVFHSSFMNLGQKVELKNLVLFINT